MNGVEKARGILPWILLSKYRNVVTSLDRTVNYYVSTTSNRVFVPAAGVLVGVLDFKHEVDVDESENKIIVRNVNGRLIGFSYTGSRHVFTAGKIEERRRKISGEENLTLDYSGKADDFRVSVLLRDIYIHYGGMLLAAIVSNQLKKQGVSITKTGKVELKITMREGDVVKEIPILVNIYEIAKDSKVITAPGVVPGVLRMISKNIITPPSEAEDVLKNTLGKIENVGRRIAGLSEALIQSTKRSEYTYIVGEAEAPRNLKDELVKKHGERMWLSKRLAGRGIAVTFEYSIPHDAVLLTVDIKPNQPPATIVMNYPPLNIAPLSLAVSGIKRAVKEAGEFAKRRLEKTGVKNVQIYIDELDPLSDAKITMNDIVLFHRRVYPYPRDIENIVEKLEKLEYIGDIVEFSLGKPVKTDRVLVREIRKATREEQREKDEIML